MFLLRMQFLGKISLPILPWRICWMISLNEKDDPHSRTKSASSVIKKKLTHFNSWITKTNEIYAWNWMKYNYCICQTVNEKILKSEATCLSTFNRKFWNHNFFLPIKIWDMKGPKRKIKIYLTNNSGVKTLEIVYASSR